MNDASSQFALVLIGRYPGKDMAVAQALARCMGRDEAWGLRIVSSAPIVFFDGLTEKQGSQIEGALAEVSNAGCRFDVQAGSISGLPKVGWSNPAKINGRTLAEIIPGINVPQAATAVHTPVQSPSARPQTLPSNLSASGPLPILNGPSASSAANGQPEHTTQASTTLVIPCPYTGKKMKVTLNITLARDDGGTALNITASAAPVVRSGERTGERSVNSISGVVIPPTASHALTPPYVRQTGPHAPLQNSGLQQRVATALPADSTRHDVRGAAAISTTPTASRSQPPVQGQPAAQVPHPAPWRQITPTEIPLPDVPILPLSNGVHPTTPDFEETPRQPLPLDSAAMDISTFEANLGMDSGAAVRPFIDSESGVFSELVAPDIDDVVSEDEEDEEILCSVFIERSSSPVVHELVAELHGIPESEASEMCVSGSVALAENIPLFEAKDIKRRCAEINVFSRIVRQD